MRKQRGIALSGLLFWGILIALIAVVGIKVAPEYIDFFKIQKSVRAVSTESSGKTVAEIRTAFDKFADVNHFSTVKGIDLVITKEGNETVITFAYEKRIPLFYNVSLLIDFQGSSSGR